MTVQQPTVSTYSNVDFPGPKTPVQPKPPPHIASFPAVGNGQNRYLAAGCLRPAEILPAKCSSLARDAQSPFSCSSLPTESGQSRPILRLHRLKSRRFVTIAVWPWYRRPLLNTREPTCDVFLASATHGLPPASNHGSVTASFFLCRIGAAPASPPPCHEGWCRAFGC